MADAIRRRALDGAIGNIAMRSSWIMKRLTKLAEGADSETVRLRALRGLVSDMITVSRYSGLEARMAELEGSLHAQPGNANRPA